jgi:hypothetical protein
MHSTPFIIFLTKLLLDVEIYITVAGTLLFQSNGVVFGLKNEQKK